MLITMDNYHKISHQNNVESIEKKFVKNLDNKELKILQAIPKKGTVDISDVSGNTLYSPSTVQKTILKLEKKGIISGKKLNKNEIVGAYKVARLGGKSNEEIKINRRTKHPWRSTWRSKRIHSRKLPETPKIYELSKIGKNFKNLIDKIHL